VKIPYGKIARAVLIKEKSRGGEKKESGLGRGKGVLCGYKERVFPCKEKRSAFSLSEGGAARGKSSRSLAD